MKKIDRTIQILTVLDILDKIDSIPDIETGGDRGERIYRNSTECSKRTTVSDAENRMENDDTSHDDELQTKKRKIENHRPMRVLRDAQNPLEALSEMEFSRAFRFSKSTVQDILKMLSYGLAKNTNRGQPVSPMYELLITLRFLATGSYQTKMCKNVSQPTISRILKRVTTLLSEQRLRFIKIPERNDFKRISSQFMQRGGCPDVFGCVGSTHIAIKSPCRNLSDSYLNELGFYSFRTLVSDG